jgi:hypothetical protein
METIDLGSFVCPRCQQTVSSDFYGPCAQCRTDLAALFSVEAREIEAVAYEPKMNVTPNAVALRD